MKKINNAFLENKDYNCFACSPRNEFGLNMSFYKDGDTVIGKWNPKSYFDGWKGVVHGGIQATLIDETGEWYIFANIGRSAVTMQLDIRYKKPLPSDKGEIKLVAKLLDLSRNIANIEISVYDSDNTLCSVGQGKFFVFSEEESKKKYSFPGKEKF
jgi:uncharacterized protein (TIGR00369 family)